MYFRVQCVYVQFQIAIYFIHVSVVSFDSWLSWSKHINPLGRVWWFRFNEIKHFFIK